MLGVERARELALPEVPQGARLEESCVELPCGWLLRWSKPLPDDWPFPFGIGEAYAGYLLVERSTGWTYDFDSWGGHETTLQQQLEAFAHGIKPTVTDLV